LNKIFILENENRRCLIVQQSKENAEKVLDDPKEWELIEQKPVRGFVLCYDLPQYK